MASKTPKKREGTASPVRLSVRLSNRRTDEPAKPTDEPSNALVGAKFGLNAPSVPSDVQPRPVHLSVRLFSVSEAANLSGVGIRAIQKAISNGRLHAEEIPIEDGHHKGRSAYQIKAADLFALYPAARTRFEAIAAAEARLVLQTEEAAAKQAAAPVPDDDVDHLKDWQRMRMDGRLALLTYRDQLRLERNISKNMAQSLVVARYAEGTLPPHLQRLAMDASARGQHISTRTLERWDQQVQFGLVGLAPKATLHAEPKWIHPFLALWRRPQKPSVLMALKQLPEVLPLGVPVPSKDQVYRYLKKIGEVEKQRGRMGDRELKTIKTFRRRERPAFPLDAWLADGHTFDAEVQHPVHGQPFRPEITSIVDLSTNRVVGWSVGLAEGAFEVVAALRHGILEHGVPAIFYSDNGPGYVNKVLDALTIRLGITTTTSIPYNSQARGVVERLHKTLYVGLLAKNLPTYIGADMDRQAKQLAYKETRKDSRKLIPWDTFLVFLQAVTEYHNASPSRALPKVVDETTGRKRYLSPDQAWQQAVDTGWSAPAVVADLHEFMPTLPRTVARGELKLFGNVYFSKTLEQLHGVEVQVAYDIHHADRVWVRTLEGRAICEATFESNKSAYFPKPFQELANEKREQGRLGRLQRQVDEIRAEASGSQRVRDITPHEQARALEARATLPLLSPLSTLQPPPNQPRNEDPENTLEGVSTEALPAVALDPDARPDFFDDIQYCRWILANPDRTDAKEMAEVEDMIQTQPHIRLALGIRLAPLTTLNPFQEAT